MLDRTGIVLIETDKYLYRIYKLLCNDFVDKWIWPTFISIGPVITGICLEWDKLRASLCSIFPFLNRVLTPVTGLLAAIFWSTFFYNFKKFLFDKYGGSSEESLGYLIEALDDPVKEKKNRFWEKFKHLQKSNPNRAQIFESITDPEKQIAILTRSVFEVFQKYAKGRIQVVLFEYKSGNLKICTFYPTDHPLSSPDELNKPNSTVRTAIKEKKLIVVSDISKEIGKKFIVTSSKRAKGSIICYPFKDQRMGDCWLVISIYSDLKGDFLDLKEIQESYKMLLERFADRFLIEYALLNFKSIKRVKK